jgi:hypothetical protein
LHLLSRPLRPRRNGEWSGSRALTFIVTLAAHRSVTLAAREAGMSRKSAYALKARDPAFAGAWDEALKSASRKRQGDEVQEVHNPRTSLSQGDKSRRTAPPKSSTQRRIEELRRDRFFARLAATRTSSAKRREFRVARPSPAQ